MFVEGGSKPERDIWSLDSLISWLETKPSDGAYEFDSTRNCMLAQYFTEMGFKDVAVGRDDFDHTPTDGERIFDVPLPASFDAIASANIPYGGARRAGKPRRAGKQWTYGEALKRALKVRADNNASPVQGLLGQFAAVFGL